MSTRYAFIKSGKTDRDIAGGNLLGPFDNTEDAVKS